MKYVLVLFLPFIKRSIIVKTEKLLSSSFSVSFFIKLSFIDVNLHNFYITFLVALIMKII